MGRPVSSLGVMTISVVLRLVEQALAGGRLAGEVEIVDTGERASVRDAEELVRFLREPKTESPPERTTTHGSEGGPDETAART